jgi:hypothetical protein
MQVGAQIYRAGDLRGRWRRLQGRGLCLHRPDGAGSVPEAGQRFVLGGRVSRDREPGRPPLGKTDRPAFKTIMWAAPVQEEHFRTGLDVNRSMATRPAPAQWSYCRRLPCWPRSRRSCATIGRAAPPAGGRLRCEFADATGSEARGSN